MVVMRPWSIAKGWTRPRFIKCQPIDSLVCITQATLRNRLFMTVTKGNKLTVNDLGAIEGDDESRSSAMYHTVVDDRSLFCLVRRGYRNRIVGFDVSNNPYF